MTTRIGAPPGNTPTLESEHDDRVAVETRVSVVVTPRPPELAREGDGEADTDDAAGRETLGVAAPRIEDDGVIARGGMGAILRVYDRSIRRYSAMKVIDPVVLPEPLARRRFIAEAQITGQLEHPHIVPVYDLELGDETHSPRFTMKLVEGETLASFIRPGRVAARKDAELWELLNVFLKVCDAVAYAHSRGVVHRDLKPENIMIGSYGQVYVMDWGIARAGGEAFADATPASALDPESGASAPRAAARPVIADGDGAFDAQGTVIGTPIYMAPEQAWGHLHEIDARTDVFALGAILYNILTGRAPYRGSPHGEVLTLARAARVRPPSEVAAGVPLSPALCEIAMKAMRCAREDRYQSALAMKRDVEKALRGGLWLGTCTFASGTVILKEGDPSDAAYIITKGRCAAFRTEHGEERKLREMGPGDVFGEMALLSSRPRSASVVAVDEVTAIVVTRETLAREIPPESWLVPLLRTLVDRFRELDEATRR